MSFLVHPTTAKLLQAMSQHPPQALLLSGSAGVGKQPIAFEWAQTTHNLAEWQIQHIQPDEKGTIAVEKVRELYQFTRVRPDHTRVIIISGAQTMSTAAQNAFLKLFEEPGGATYFILTTDNSQKILPTIRSRAQELSVLSPSLESHQTYLAKQHPQLSDTDNAQLLFIAGGLPDLANRLANDTLLFEEYKQLAAQAKVLITPDRFQKILWAGKVSDRQAAITTLELALQMCGTLMGRASGARELAKWNAARTALLTTLERITANGNLKIQLTQLAFALG